MHGSTNRRKLAVCSQIVLACYWAAFFGLTHLPAGTALLPARGWDKVEHVLGYAVFAALLATTWQLSAEYLTTRHLWWTWVLVVLYAAFDELTQIPVGRTASVWDWLADAIGAAIGLLMFVWLRRRCEKRYANRLADSI